MSRYVTPRWPVPAAEVMRPGVKIIWYVVPPQRCVMRFQPAVAPIKAGIYPLINKEEFNPYITKISSALMDAGKAPFEGRELTGEASS